MKRTLIIVFTIVCILSYGQKSHAYIVTYLEYSTGRTFEEEYASNKYYCEYTKTDDISGYTIESNMGYTILDESKTYENAYKWHSPGFPLVQDPGKPEIGQWTFHYLVPDGVDHLSLELLEMDYIDFNYKLAPCLGWGIEGDLIPVEMKPYTGFYPEVVAYKGYNGKYREYRYQDIVVFCAQYDQEHEIVRAYTHIKFRLNFETEAGTEEIEQESEPKTYYNLQGNIVTNPKKGEFYIEHYRNSFRKIRF